MIQGQKVKSDKHVIIGEGIPVTEEVVQQTFFGMIWSVLLYFMWLPLSIPVAIAKFQFEIGVRIVKTLLPYFVSVWKSICNTTP